MKERSKEPRRQVGGIVGINTLALIIGLENIERALNVYNKNRRISKERRQESPNGH